ncbi:MAG: hypothetical protein LBB63_00620 [Holosporaceae bacterium]|jgi:hypothetical protein|nr:hypothetical protein [Holosporaceae bacterium]
MKNGIFLLILCAQLLYSVNCHGEFFYDVGKALTSIESLCVKDELEAALKEKCGNEKQLTHLWLISADQIFTSHLKDYEEYCRFYGMEFFISRPSSFEKEKTSDSDISAKNVKIYIPSGPHCILIQEYMVKKTIIPQIVLKRVVMLNKTPIVLEKKEFSGCTIQSFSRVFFVDKEEVAFTFSYLSSSDSYAFFENDGAQVGDITVEINPITGYAE